MSCLAAARGCGVDECAARTPHVFVVAKQGRRFTSLGVAVFMFTFGKRKVY